MCLVEVESIGELAPALKQELTTFHRIQSRFSAQSNLSQTANLSTLQSLNPGTAALNLAVVTAALLFTRNKQSLSPDVKYCSWGLPL
jgi:hypothetical protein